MPAPARTTADMSRALDPRLSRPERVLLLVDRALGYLLTVAGAFLVYLWLDGRNGSDPHGGIFAFIFAAWITPAGLLFLVAGAAVSRRWAAPWLIQLLPFAYSIVSAAWLEAAFG